MIAFSAVAHKNFLETWLAGQSGHQIDAWFGASGSGVTNRRRLIRPQNRWKCERGEIQERGKPQQSFFHGVISFSGELRRDNVLTKAVRFTGPG